MMKSYFIYYLQIFKKIFIVFFLSFIKKYKFRKKIQHLKSKLIDKKKYLVVLNTSSIGALTSQLNYFYKYSKIYNLSIKDDFYFLASKKNICNNYLIDKICETIEINYDDNLYDLLNNYGGLKSFVINKLCIPFANDFINILPGINFPIKFSSIEESTAKSLLKKCGILKEKNIVGISCKDSTYWDNKSIEKKWDIYRYSSFNRLELAIEYLKKNNFTIIHLGENTIPSDLEDSIISLGSLSNDEREFIDIYIFTITKFVILGAQGLKFVAELFSVPVLSHNSFLPQWQSDGIFLPKKFKDKENNIIPYRKLLKKRILELDVDQGFIKLKYIEPLIFRNISQFKIKGIILEQNSSIEILEATKEMLLYIIYKDCNLISEDLELQNKIRKIFYASEVNSNSIINYGFNFGGYFSFSFLKSNREIIDN